MKTRDDKKIRKIQKLETSMTREKCNEEKGNSKTKKEKVQITSRILVKIN